MHSLASPVLPFHYLIFFSHAIHSFDSGESGSKKKPSVRVIVGMGMRSSGAFSCLMFCDMTTAQRPLLVKVIGHF